MCSWIDIATETVETPEQVQATLRRALEFVPAERLCPATNCGMALLPREVARRKLRALTAGAALLRRELKGA
jgi:5-methyltetrahydropteroyltriglutamate--homocysteine methyltransferase